MPRPASPRTVCGLRNLPNPASGIGLIATIRAPRRFASSSAVSIRGWLVPGFCPAMTIRSAYWAMSSRLTVPLPMPIVADRAAPEDSWHMFEQSGRLLVPSRRASSWYTNAASLLARPLV